MITALIMAGGEGTRFWPLSRKDNPKQFLKLNDKDKTMLEETVDRINKLVPLEQIFVATNKSYQSQVKQLLEKIPSENIIIEPMKRNTAACIGLSSIVIKEKYPASTVIVLPSDHIIKKEEQFISILKKAVMAASQGENLVTLGVKPDSPKTGYGYINYGDSVHNIDGYRFFKVNKFTEKPDLNKAKNFLKDGNYLWNSGIFIWKLDSILAKFQKHLPDLFAGLQRMKLAFGSDSEAEVIAEEFNKLESISIDYGIMEKSKNILVIPVSLGWNDIGSWTALSSIKEKDEAGNVNQAAHYSIDTKNSIIYSDTDKIIATIGLSDFIIVETKDALLVCEKKRAQDVKKIRKILEDRGLEAYL
jgi:mannose-1-phosphate guanylyltransferase